MADRVEDLAAALARFPGIGPRQAHRFVYYLLSVPQHDRARLAELIQHIGTDVRQCHSCYRFFNGGIKGDICNYCSDPKRDDSLLMIVEKDQDLLAVERANTYRGRYFVLGGILTLSGKGHIREREMVHAVEQRLQNNLKEVVLALSATSEGEHTADHVRELLIPLREHIKLTVLGRGLSTGSELEYADSATLSAALLNRKET